MVRHLRAIMMLPFMVTLVIPTILLLVTRGELSSSWTLSNPLSWLLIVVGMGFILFGISMLARTILLFETIGDGTLAPWNPPQHLVVAGVYRYTRNPMITGIFAILLGEVILFGAGVLLVWLAFFFHRQVDLYIPIRRPHPRSTFWRRFQIVSPECPQLDSAPYPVGTS